MKKKKVLFAIFVLCNLVSLIGIIIVYTKRQINSDSATFLLLAQQQLKQKKFFPEGFHYTTGIAVFTLNLLIIPFMKLCSDWILCRIGAVIVQTFIGMILIFFLWFERERKYPWKAAVMCILLALPISFEVLEHFYFQASYFTWCIKLIMAIISIKLYMDADIIRKKNLLLFFVIITTILTLIGSSKNILIFVIPMVCALVIEALLEHKFKLINMIRSAEDVKLTVTMLLATVLGTSITQFLYTRTNSTVSSIGGVSFTDSGNVGLNIGLLFERLIELYGASGQGSLISLSAIVKVLCLLYLLASIFVMPILVIKFWREITNKFTKVLFIYCMVANLAIIYMGLFSTATATRYYLNVYLNSIIVFVIGIDLIKNKIDSSWNWTLAFIGMSAACLVHINLWSGRSDYIFTEAQGEQSIVGIEVRATDLDKVVEIVEQEKVTYGFASYWNAYATMVYADGEINMGALIFDSNMEAYLWGNADEIYDTTKFQGKSCLLLGEEEVIPGNIYAAASQIYHINKFTLLIFEKNFLEIRDETYEQKITSEAMWTSDNGYILEQGANLRYQAFGYASLMGVKQGEYTISINGNNLDAIDCKVYGILENQAEEILINNIQKYSDIITYEIKVENDISTVHFYNCNLSDGNLAKIDLITIKKNE